jgi:smad nuclear-interacting protein 1
VCQVKGIVIAYNEPMEAAKPDLKWRLYVFKNGTLLPELLYIHRNSWYMFGRERKIVDIPTDHPSCSKQHAVLQVGHQAGYLRLYSLDIYWP